MIMNKLANGSRSKGWIEFKKMVAAVMVGRKLCASFGDGYRFAESLDWSFNELFENVPRREWLQHIEKDCDEYERSIRKHGE